MIIYDSVTKIYGKGKDAVTALDNINFTIPRDKEYFRSKCLH